MTDQSHSDDHFEAASLPRVVLADANVFFSPRLRDLFMTLHVGELLMLRWTRQIEDEWTRNVAKKHAVAVDALRACTRGMHSAVPDWEVRGSEGLEWAFNDVSPTDRHVAAAAYQLATKDFPSEGVALVTHNLRDFASSLLLKKRVMIMSPGAYLDQALRLWPERVLAVAEQCRRKLKQPPLALLEYVNVLRNLGCRHLPMALLKRSDLVFPHQSGAPSAALEVE